MAEEDVMRVGKRVYVSNLAWRTSWQDLKDRFREVGEVVYANVIKDDAGRSKGWGIVEYATPEEAVEAISKLNATDLGGRTILVREDREDRDVKQYNQQNGVQPAPRVPRAPRAAGPGGRGGRGGRGPRPSEGEEAAAGEAVSSHTQVVVHGLPWGYTWKELKDLFAGANFTNIVRADIAYGRDGRSRGYGTVKFEDEATAQAAIDQFNGSDLEGRTLTVKFDQYA